MPAFSSSRTPLPETRGLGVNGGDVNPGDAAFDDCGCAGWGTSGEAARFESDVYLRATGGGAGLIQSDYLGVGLARGPGIALSDDLAIPHHHGTDGGVRGGDAKGAPRQRDTVLHVAHGGEG